MTTGLIAVALAAASALYFWSHHRARRLAAGRLTALVDTSAAATEVEGAMASGKSRPFPPRYHAVPPIVGAVFAAALWLLVNVPIQVSVAAGAVAGVLAWLGEAAVAERRIAAIEIQLAEAIDLLIGSLRAGSSLLAAFDSALQVAAPPLRPYLQELAGRIRLGDDPRAAIGDLPVQVPLETFRLFASSLVVHWEAGGSIAATLATVGRTIRDRIEQTRRVHAQGIEAHVSVGVVMAIAYVLAYLMWRADPERLLDFVRTDVGTDIVAFVIGLQAVGLVWIARLSRAEF